MLTKHILQLCCTGAQNGAPNGFYNQPTARSCPSFLLDFFTDVATADVDHKVLVLIISSTLNYCNPVCISSSGIPHQLADFSYNRFKADIYNSLLEEKKKSDWITVHKPVYSCLP